MTWKFTLAAALMLIAIALTIMFGERCRHDSVAFRLGHILLAGCGE